MHHCYALHAGPLDSSTLKQVPVVSDGVFTTRHEHFVFSRDYSIFAGYAQGLNLTQVRLWTSSLEQVTRPNIRPISIPNTRTVGGDTFQSIPDDPNLADWFKRPFPVGAGEELGIEASSSDTSDLFIVLWAASRLVPAPQGPTYTLMASASGGGAVNAWADVSLTFERTLAPGRFAVVSSEVYSTDGDNLLAHRWIFDGQAFRPGALCQATPGGRVPSLFSGTTLGVWGTFYAPIMPRLQVLRTSKGEAGDNTTAFLTVIPL